MKQLALLVVSSFVVLVAACGGRAVGTGAVIEGVVLLGPQCPVVEEGSPCPDEAIAADVVVSTPDGDRVASVRSGADGRFRVAVDPGAYVLTVEGLEGIQFAKPVEVTVAEGQVVEVTVLVDTGIR